MFSCCLTLLHHFLLQYSLYFTIATPITEILLAKFLYISADGRRKARIKAVLTLSSGSSSPHFYLSIQQLALDDLPCLRRLHLHALRISEDRYAGNSLAANLKFSVRKIHFPQGLKDSPIGLCWWIDTSSLPMLFNHGGFRIYLQSLVWLNVSANNT